MKCVSTSQRRLIAISPGRGERRLRQHGDMHGDKLARSSFRTSCNPAVQEKLLRGIAMLLSLLLFAAQQAFEGVGRGGPLLHNRSAWGYAPS